jgi:hypothetical protein
VGRKRSVCVYAYRYLATESPWTILETDHDTHTSTHTYLYRTSYIHPHTHTLLGRTVGLLGVSSFKCEVSTIGRGNCRNYGTSVAWSRSLVLAPMDSTGCGRNAGDSKATKCRQLQYRDPIPEYAGKRVWTATKSNPSRTKRTFPNSQNQNETTATAATARTTIQYS